MDAKEQLLVYTVPRCSNMALLGPEMYTISRLTRYIAKQHLFHPGSCRMNNQPNVKGYLLLVEW